MHVVAVDDMSGGRRANIPTHKHVTFVQGDVKDAQFLDALFTAHKFDFVYHLAAYSAGGMSHFVRSYNYRNNLVGSVELVNQAVSHGVKCFVFASSIAVYGAAATPMVESMAPQPKDPYGVAKYAVEMDLRNAQEVFGMDFVVVRPHNVYGPGQHPYEQYRNVVGIFMNQVLRGEPMSIVGDGQQTRAFSYIDDVAPVTANAPLVPEARNQVFNVGTDTPTTVTELSVAVAKAMGTPHTVAQVEARHEVAHAYGSQAKARCYFGASQGVSLEEGLRRTAAWRREVAKADSGAPAPSTALSTVEVMAQLPASWKHSSMKRAAVVDLVGPQLPVMNNVQHIGSSCQVDCESEKVLQAYHNRVNEALAIPADVLPSPTLWRQPGGMDASLLSGARPAAGSGPPPRPRTLLSIHTAMSAWHITQLMLVSLASVTDEFDVVLIDDHSTELDIPTRAEEWGVKVLRWGEATEAERAEHKGLTHSWNLAWQYFLDHDEYDNLIVCNNDLIIPNGTISRMSSALASGWAWLLPVVSMRGSANPHHRLHDHFDSVKKGDAESWTNHIMTYEAVQRALTRPGLERADTVPFAPPASRLKRKVFPNGYMMGFRKELMVRAQFDKKQRLLWDPHLLNIGQEQSLWAQMKKAAAADGVPLPVGVHTGAYVFHFKGYTLSRAPDGDRDKLSGHDKLDDRGIPGSVRKLAQDVVGLPVL